MVSPTLPPMAPLTSRGFVELLIQVWAFCRVIGAEMVREPAVESISMPVLALPLTVAPLSVSGIVPTVLLIKKRAWAGVPDSADGGRGREDGVGSRGGNGAGEQGHVASGRRTGVVPVRTAAPGGPAGKRPSIRACGGGTPQKAQTQRQRGDHQARQQGGRHATRTGTRCLLLWSKLAERYFATWQIPFA